MQERLVYGENIAQTAQFIHTGAADIGIIALALALAPALRDQGRWSRTFLRIVLPLSWAGILTGLVLTFAHTIGEFGVVLMVGGSIPGVTRTVSVAIYDEVQALNYAAAHQTALFLLLISFAVLAVTYALQRRVVVL